MICGHERMHCVELRLSRAVVGAPAFTKQQRQNWRRREKAREGRGTRAQLAVQSRRRQTERRAETGSSSRDYAPTRSDDVNGRVHNSLQDKNLAPQVGFEPTTLRLTAVVPASWWSAIECD